MQLEAIMWRNFKNSFEWRKSNTEELCIVCSIYAKSERRQVEVFLKGYYLGCIHMEKQDE